MCNYFDKSRVVPRYMEKVKLNESLWGHPGNKIDTPTKTFALILGKNSKNLSRGLKKGGGQ